MLLEYSYSTSQNSTYILFQNTRGNIPVAADAGALWRQKVRGSIWGSTPMMSNIGYYNYWSLLQWVIITDKRNLMRSAKSPPKTPTSSVRITHEAAVG